MYRVRLATFLPTLIV